VRRSGSTRMLFRTLLCLGALVALGLVEAGSAGAATITSWIGGKGATPTIVTAGGGACVPTMITVNGSGFVSDGGVRGVTIGGVPASEIIVGSNNILYARLGAGATNGPVVVTTPAGSVTASPNALVVPCQSTGTASGKPTISTVTSKAKAGKKIRLLGTGFVGTTSVKVGGLAATYAIPGDNIMYVIMPTDAKTGVVTIEVTNDKGAAKASVVKIG
jgi:hypothetical protein